MYRANQAQSRQGHYFVLQFKLTKKQGNIHVVSSYCSRQYVSGLSSGGEKNLAGFRNSLCANDAVFAQSLLSKARNHNCCWPETHIYLQSISSASSAVWVWLHPAK